MTIFEMDMDRRGKLYHHIKFHFPRWKKYGWIWSILWSVLIVTNIIFAFRVYCELDMRLDQSFWSSLFVLEVCLWVPAGIFMAVVYAFLISEAGELLVPEQHRILFSETGFRSEWIPQIMQIRNVQGDQVITIFPYGNVKRILWNDSLQRLEIYGDYQQQIHSVDIGSHGWEPRERTFFTFSKTEKCLYLYNYFPEMESLIVRLQAECGVSMD